MEVLLGDSIIIKRVKCLILPFRISPILRTNSSVLISHNLGLKPVSVKEASGTELDGVVVPYTLIILQVEDSKGPGLVYKVYRN